MGIYKGQWNSYSDMCSDFEYSGVVLPEDEKIIFAFYNYENYSGIAFILFKQGDKFYEVNSYHCSCNGLSDWEPEETTLDAVAMREFYDTTELQDIVREFIRQYRK